MEELTIGNIKFKTFDLGGHTVARKVWSEYFQQVDAVVYMVDTVDRERFMESKAELDRFIEAMKGIRAEIAEVEAGVVEAERSVLRGAPHSAQVICGDWDRSYSRDRAAFPTTATRQSKFWPTVSRIDEAFGGGHEES